MSVSQLRNINQKIEDCTRCSRLIRHCREIARVKKKEFRSESYWGRPVPGFGDPKARLWILGLAPAAHGANRTGRMFTGDSSGRWLYGALHRAGFANQPDSTHLEDGLKLTDVYVSAAARCAPPDNKPTLEEIECCENYLDEEFEALKNKRIVLALGSIAFRSALRLFQRNGIALKPRPEFGHHRFYDLGEIGLLSSYHPSRQNTQTGKLTVEMWDAIYKEARERLG